MIALNELPGGVRRRLHYAVQIFDATGISDKGVGVLLIAGIKRQGLKPHIGGVKL